MTIYIVKHYYLTLDHSKHYASFLTNFCNLMERWVKLSIDESIEKNFSALYQRKYYE